MPPMPFFFLAVLVSSLYAGKGAGLLSVALAAAAYSYLFLPFRSRVSVQSPPATFSTDSWVRIGVRNCDRTVGSPLIEACSQAKRYVNVRPPKGGLALVRERRK